MSQPPSIWADLRLAMRRQGGAMTWHDFMEMALYHKVDGYYRKPGRIGRAGDFYTSVSTGPLFGRLLAGYLNKLLNTLPGGPLCVWECGANSGQLARDVQPHLRPDVTYRTREVDDPWPEPFRGILLSNELLDALPCHRVVSREGRWREWYVAETHPGTLAWVEGGLSSARLEEALRAWPAEAFDGVSTEVNLHARAWIGQAARVVTSGWVITFDYGIAEAVFPSPHRPEGTLRGYRNHQWVQDLLADPGGQDLTADVDFPAIIEEGRRHGLETVRLLTQGHFFERECADGLLELAQATVSERRQVQTLLHPAFLGNALRVLVQRVVSA